jgi:hypothetical protein
VPESHWEKKGKGRRMRRERVEEIEMAVVVGNGKEEVKEEVS